MIDGTLHTIDGRPALRFERLLNHPVDRVWRAVSEPAELERWFPAATDWTPAIGEKFEAYGATGEVTEVDPPHRLAWTYGTDQFRFELTGEDGGCRLVFVHVFADRALAAQTAAGWDAYLTRLVPHLDGGHLSEEQAHGHWGEIHEGYAERFGVDPTPGREFAESLRAAGDPPPA